MSKKLLFIIFVLFILTACAKAECKKDVDCSPRKAFQVSCIDKNCVYTPIPNECGNRQCEPGANENECTCPQDCGQCTGAVEGSEYLVQKCVDDQCMQDVKTVTPIYVSADLSSGGDKFKVETEYNQPFNLKKDTFAFTVTLTQQGTRNSEEKLLTAELTAMTKDRRTVTLARQDVNKYLWQVGSKVHEELILDFPTGELEEELSTLNLKITYEYKVTTATTVSTKTATLQNRYKEKLVYVNPTATYDCPSCDDGNPGTKDTCGPQTNYFCMHSPIPNACGNFICDSRENKCTCPEDCGPCTGSAGQYVNYACQRKQCVTELKSGVVITPSSIFDDRSLGPVQLNNNYNFNNPFDVSTDKLSLDFKVYRQDPTVSSVAIETVRVLEGQQQLAEVPVNQELGETPITVEVTLPQITKPEEERSLVVKIWYKYVQNEQEKLGSFQKPLGKVTLINPQ